MVPQGREEAKKAGAGICVRKTDMTKWGEKDQGPEVRGRQKVRKNWGTVPEDGVRNRAKRHNHAWKLLGVWLEPRSLDEKKERYFQKLSGETNVSLWQPYRLVFANKNKT